MSSDKKPLVYISTHEIVLIDPYDAKWGLSCFENSVDPDQLASESQLIRIHTVSHSASKCMLEHLRGNSSKLI